MVTGTFHTDKAGVLDLRFSGQDEPIGTTTAHPFWSVTRQRFVPAGELYVGEEVVALDGQTFRLTSITPRAGPEPVFNLEIANQHTFFVSKNGLLVHNAKKCAPLSSRVTKGTQAPPPGPASSIKRANGNAKSSNVTQSLYVIVNKKTGEYLKVGITGRDIKIRFNEQKNLVASRAGLNANEVKVVLVDTINGAGGMPARTLALAAEKRLSGILIMMKGNSTTALPSHLSPRVPIW